jgi:hypothetical protein
MTITYSLWYMQKDIWKGYKDINSVLKSDILPKDTIISVNGARYEQDEIDQIKAAGFVPTVWSWYLMDMETVNMLHYHGMIMDHEFDLLPADAGRQVVYYTADNVYHRINYPTLYVGCRKLWDPHPRSSMYLREFTDSVFGFQASKIIANAIETLGKIRCGCRSWKESQTHFFKDINPRSCSCNLGKGTNDPEQDFKSASRAIKELEDIMKSDSEFKSLIPLVISPKELIYELKEHLEFIKTLAKIKSIEKKINQIPKSDSKRIVLIEEALNITIPEFKKTLVSFEYSKYYIPIRHWIENERKISVEKQNK